MRDNPIAITEGASGAPSVQPDAMNYAVSVGDYSILHRKLGVVNVPITGFTEKLGIYCNIAGTYRCRCWTRNYGGGAGAQGQWYIDAVATGSAFTLNSSSTWTANEQDIALAAGEVLGLYVDTSFSTGTCEIAIDLCIGVGGDNSANTAFAPMVIEKAWHPDDQ
ncbi:MAG: hypothetical protein HKO06_06695 [Pseudomonadales bacterium]|nr:hypothetical protein [Pseudomonadales bacterium]